MNPPARRAPTVALLALLAGFAWSGCNAIGGIQDGVLAASDATAGEAASDDAGHAEGGPTDAGKGDVTTGDATLGDAGNHPMDAGADDSQPEADAGAGDDGGSMTEGGAGDAGCTVNTTECADGGVVLQCNASGQWVSGASCPYVCENGACAGMCVPGTQQCNGNTPETCSSTGTWTSGTPCPSVCSAGVCAGSCIPGSMECNGGTPQTCNSAGGWQNGTPCPYVCSGQGVCTGACVPGATQPCGSVATCNAGQTQTCDATGAWLACSTPNGSCVAVPSGWQPYATTSAVCPGGFGNPQGYIETASGGPDTCACTCTGGPQTCTATAQLQQGSSCTGGTVVASLSSLDGTCHPASGLTLINPDEYAVTNVVASPTPTCGATPSVTNIPSVQETSAQLCSPALACPSGACLSAAQQGRLCAAQSGDVACPAGFPSKTLLASGTSDTRGCGACSCGSTLSCSLVNILFESDNACSYNGAYIEPLSVFNFCAQQVSNPTFTVGSIQGNFAVDGGGACSTVTTASSPTGVVGLDPSTTLTVCCP